MDNMKISADNSFEVNEMEDEDMKIYVPGSCSAELRESDTDEVKIYSAAGSSPAEQSAHLP